MSGKSKEFTEQLQTRARQIISERNISLSERVEIRPLAKQLLSETGCNIDTAKGHIAKAIRRARWDMTHAEPPEATSHGGRREGAGRPPKENE